MNLPELRSGERVFIDANIFIYHFGGRSQQCRAMLERCARGNVLGYTATSVLAEILHRLMLAEAVQTRLVTAKNAVKRLAERPELVRRLTTYNEDVDKISQMNLTILSLTPDIVAKSAAIRMSDGLLTNDSFVGVFMREWGLTNLATTDRDFERVAGLEVYAPTDL